MNDTTIAYVAGLLDGEGYFGVGKKADGHYAPTLQVNMTDRNIVEWLHQNFGGSFLKRTPPNSRCEIPYTWVLSDRPTLIRLLPQLLSHLRIKRLQALVLLDFCEKSYNPRRHTRTTEEINQQEMYFRIMQLSNSRGPGSSDLKSRILEVVTSRRAP